MYRSISATFAIIAACAVSGCATTQPVTNANGSEAVVSQDHASHEGQGQLAMQNGQAWTATNLFKKAVRKHNTQLDRFNLASAYEATGRYKEAAHYYQTVIDDGHTQEVDSIPNNAIANNVSVPIEVVAESKRRLPLLGTQRDEVVRFSKARTVGGPRQGDVSDEEARRLDGLALAIAASK